LRKWLAAAKALGHAYIAITDHSKAVTVANGLDEKRMHCTPKGYTMRTTAALESVFLSAQKSIS